MKRVQVESSAKGSLQFFRGSIVRRWVGSVAGILAAVPTFAVEIEPLGKALTAILGTPKVAKKSLKVNGKDVPVFVAKGADGKVQKAAFIEKGIYEPDCTHTWAVGIDPSSGSVTEVRVVEMKCPHAFPTKASSFLEQFKGKGPADVEKLVEGVDVVAKATGSSKLAAEAVKRSIQAFEVAKSQL